MSETLTHLAIRFLQLLYISINITGVTCLVWYCMKGKYFWFSVGVTGSPFVANETNARNAGKVKSIIMLALQ